MKSFLIYAASLLAVLPIHAMSPAPEPKPVLSMEKALELAKEYIRDKKIDVSHHYIDRIWIGYQEGKPDRRWIISWSPNPEDPKEPKGWIILRVKLDGTVTDEAGAVPWLQPRIFGPGRIEPPPVIKPPPTK